MSMLARFLLVMGLVVSVTTCGDMEDIEDEEIRTFVNRVKNVLREEFTDVEDDKLDDIERIIVEELQDGAPSSSESCWEVGRKSVYTAKIPSFILSGFLGNKERDDLDPQSTELVCADNVEGEGVVCAMDGCECEASKEKNSMTDNYAAHCHHGVQELDYNYTEEEVSSPNPPANGGGQAPPEPEMAKYNLDPNNLGQKEVGDVFEVSITVAAGEASPTTMERNLYAYDTNDTEVNRALAVWTTSGNIYDDVYLAANDPEENFEVFMTRAAVDRVTNLGGEIGSEDLGMASISVVEPTCCSMSAIRMVGEQPLPGGAIIPYSFTLLFFTTDPDSNSAGIRALSTDSSGEVLFSSETPTGYKSDIHQWMCDGNGCGLNLQDTCEVGNLVFARVEDKVYQATCEEPPAMN